jgi:homocysteine S-methyltransferase
MSNLLTPFIKESGIVILDGALATELESRGADLNHPLWSAKLLSENPNLIKEVHKDYLLAGANVLITASYQASFEGFAKYGYSKQEATALMQLSVQLAIEARDEVAVIHDFNGHLPLIAASVGPFGASLADGSEYRGDYGLTVEELMNFHRERMRVLVAAGADLLACETIPCFEEGLALALLLKEFPDVKAWISYSCKDGEHVCSGTAFSECAALANDCKQVIATGVNCTPPQYVQSLIQLAAKATKKPLLAYPNKGEVWDAAHKCWLPGTVSANFTQDAITWFTAGATLIGGCCQTSPADIAALKNYFATINTN